MKTSPNNKTLYLAHSAFPVLLESMMDINFREINKMTEQSV
jgi:hypothetical protein